MSRDRSLDKLFKQLDGLDKAMRGKVLRKGLRSGAKVLASQVRSEAPVESGRTKKSVKVRSGRRKKDQISTVVEVTGGHDEAFIGFVEFGTKEQKANPFIRRSVSAKREEVVDAIADAVGRGIAEAIGK